MPKANNNGVNIDIVTQNGGGFSGSGSVAKRLMESNFNVNSLRANGTLRYREWIQFDQKVVWVARQRLVAVGDLITRGLSFPVANALGITRVEWENLSDMTAAEVSMSGVAPGQADRTTYDLNGIPLPIIHKDFEINIRALAASRQMGQSPDTTMAALASRRVAEKIEDIFFNGLTLQSANSKIYGLTTAPHRNVGGLSGNWADETAVDGTDIIQDILSMMEALQLKHMYGPYGVYVPITYGNRLQDDYKTFGSETIMERILEIDGIEFVKPTANLLDGASGEVSMVQLSTDVVDIIDGIQPTMVQWEEGGGMTQKFKVMGIVIPRFKADSASQSGVAHFNVGNTDAGT